MAMSSAKTVDDYIASLPADRRDAIAAVRKVVKKNLPKGFEEGLQFGMPSWYVPLAKYPDTYNGKPLLLAGLAAQKGYNALYLLSVYGDPALQTWFVDAYERSGKKLDMGKSCVRFKSLEDLPLEVVGEAIARVGYDDYIARYEQVKPPKAKKAGAAGASKKTGAKAPAAGRTPTPSKKSTTAKRKKLAVAAKSARAQR
jgi:uncharacterized protein YdhG (YjbR/CyaY superfamily)